MQCVENTYLLQRWQRLNVRICSKAVNFILVRNTSCKGVSFGERMIGDWFDDWLGDRCGGWCDDWCMVVDVDWQAWKFFDRVAIFISHLIYCQPELLQRQSWNTIFRILCRFHRVISAQGVMAWERLFYLLGYFTSRSQVYLNPLEISMIKRSPSHLLCRPNMCFEWAIQACSKCPCAILLAQDDLNDNPSTYVIFHIIQLWSRYNCLLWKVNCSNLMQVWD